MWIAYVLVVVLALIAVGTGVLGVWIGTIFALLLLAGLMFVVLTARGRGGRLERVEDPHGVPDTRSASAEPRVDPSRTPPGSSIGSP
jgi:hypothetical protein